ncbi:MAG: mechanosensitive ion channel family protein [Deltaproteobacteria bacterium]|nr:mechanosensitive ion channel family protein [Deltaproteobacteria bacterium]
MISKLHYYGTSLLLLVTLIAAPGTAQPLDGRNESTSPPESQTEAPPKQSETEPASREPPLWLARRPSDAATGGEARPAGERSPVLSLFLWLLAVGLVLFIVERARNWITKNIPLRSALGALVFVLRIAVFSLLVAIVFAVVPSDQNWILGALAVLALVVGWSVRDLFADLVAGAILAAERRVKKGMWVSGDGFQGTVEGRSLRATWLRDGQGHRITVPNRAMVGAPMVYDAGADAEHEVVVRLEGYRDAGKVRMALTDAILSSPWVLAGATPVVLRDPADPIVWRVRTKLLEPRFSVHFEGELLERVEDLLRYEPVSDGPEADRVAAEPVPVPGIETED